MKLLWNASRNLNQNISKYIVDWSEESLITFENIFDFIVNKWSYRIAEKFETKVVFLVKNLENNLHLCPSSKRNDIRKCVVTKQTSLIYEVKNNKIFLLTFIDNRMEHLY